MRYYEIISERVMTKSDAGFGLTQYEGTNYLLHGGTRNGNPTDRGHTRLNFDIYSLEALRTDPNDIKNAKLGYCDLVVQDGTGIITGLVDIKLNPKKRKQGTGKEIIQDIVDTAPNDLKIYDIQKSAMGFWKKMGIELEKGKGSQVNGILHKNHINESVVIDNSMEEKNLGVTGYNANIDYRGLRVMMKPSTFLKLARFMPGEHSEYIENHIKNGGAIGSPFLIIDLPPAWTDSGDFSQPARVIGHEGRNRMKAIRKLYGDEPIEVHIIVSGEFRARNFTPAIIKEIQNGMESEGEHIYWKGPLFATSSLKESADVKKTVYHVTRKRNVKNIMANGLVPKIGTNSRMLGETEKAIHVFYDPIEMEDAIANWDLFDEDAVLSVLRIKIDPSLVRDDPAYPGSIGLIRTPVPPSDIEITDIQV